MIEFLYEITFCCLFSIEVFECFCFNCVSWWCSVMRSVVLIHFCGVPFSWWVFSWYFPGCSFEVCWSALMSLVIFAALQFHSAGKAVHFECVFVCVWVFRSILIRLFILELVSHFSILLHSAACLSWMWFCRFQPCRSLPSLVEKFCQFIVFASLVDLIGQISHARFLWETWPHADPWLIAQLSLLFLSYVFVIHICHLIKSLQQCCHGNLDVNHWSDLFLVAWWHSLLWLVHCCIQGVLALYCPLRSACAVYTLCFVLPYELDVV